LLTSKVSARTWDPLVPVLLNKAVSTIMISAARSAHSLAEEEMVTLYRSISAAEANSIKTTQKFLWVREWKQSNFGKPEKD
jgi:hypothetical protein